MKINYEQNPLNTTIELDEHEKKDFFNKIKINELENVLCDVYFHLKDNNIEKAKKSLKIDYFISDNKSDLDKRCELILNHYLNALNNSHNGDCTCESYSCDKCHAESLLNINTIEGLDKHEAYQIYNAFKDKNNIDNAILVLGNYQPLKSGVWEKYSDEEFSKHATRWKKEAKLAHDWLIKYKEEHLN